MNRTPRENLLAAILLVMLIVGLAALLWILKAIWSPQPAESLPVKPVASRSEGRPSMSAREYVALATYKYRWDTRQWKCLDALIDAESHWSLHAKNPVSSASGLFQMLDSPSGKVFRRYNLADQSRIGTAYIAGRYKNPCAAYAFERLHNYY